MELKDIGGRARLEKRGHKVFSLCEFEGGNRCAKNFG